MEGLFGYVTGTAKSHAPKNYISREELGNLIEEAILWHKTKVVFTKPLNPHDVIVLKDEGFQVIEDDGEWKIKWPHNDPEHYSDFESFEDLLACLEERIPLLPRRYKFVRKFHPEFMDEYEKLLTPDYIEEHDPEVTKFEKPLARCGYYCSWYPTISHCYPMTLSLDILMDGDIFIGYKWTHEQIVAVYSRIAGSDPRLLDLLPEFTRYNCEQEAVTESFEYFYLKLSDHLKSQLLLKNGHPQRKVILEKALSLDLIVITEATAISLIRDSIYEYNLIEGMKLLDLNREIDGTTVAKELVRYISNEMMYPDNLLESVKVLSRADLESLDLNVEGLFYLRHLVTEWNGVPVTVTNTHYGGRHDYSVSLRLLIAAIKGD